VLGTSTTEFAILSTAGAFGGVLGGWVASRVSRRIGSGPSLALTIIGGAICLIAIGLVSSWPAAFIFLFVEMFVAVLWNVITVSLRQTIIPDRLLGRVNSVYRFFGWGAIPIGALIGGALAAGLEGPLSREWALRATLIIPGVVQLVAAVFALPKLTTAKMNAARAEATVSAASAITQQPI
jgi:MFS family permease